MRNADTARIPGRWRETEDEKNNRFDTAILLNNVDVNKVIFYEKSQNDAGEQPMRVDISYLNSIH